jgi:hypothetical protein
MQIDDWNRTAVRTLLEDAGRTLARLEVENLRGNREVVRDAMAHARRNYFDFVRRGRPLIMSNDDQVAFQKTLDRLTDTGGRFWSADEGSLAVSRLS